MEIGGSADNDSLGLAYQQLFQGFKGRDPSPGAEILEKGFIRVPGTQNFTILLRGLGITVNMDVPDTKNRCSHSKYTGFPVLLEV